MLLEVVLINSGFFLLFFHMDLGISFFPMHSSVRLAEISYLVLKYDEVGMVGVDCSS